MTGAKKLPAGLRVECPVCGSEPGVQCTKIAEHTGGLWPMTIAHKRRRAVEARTQPKECCCAGPHYRPDKPCPIHPKVTAVTKGTP